MLSFPAESGNPRTFMCLALQMHRNMRTEGLTMYSNFSCQQICLWNPCSSAKLRYLISASDSTESVRFRFGFLHLHSVLTSISRDCFTPALFGSTFLLLSAKIPSAYFEHVTFIAVVYCSRGSLFGKKVHGMWH